MSTLNAENFSLLLQTLKPRLYFHFESFLKKIVFCLFCNCYLGYVLAVAMPIFLRV